MPSKSARLEARLSPEHRDLIQQAAAIRGLSISDFVLSCSLSEARRAIAEDETLKLSRADQIRFAKSLTEPGPVAPALKRAAQAHRKHVVH